MNINDFGTFFHGGTKSTPNAYGPILLRVDPDCIEDSADVVLSLRSAGHKEFSRQAESLKKLEDVARLFAFPKDHETKARWLKSKSDLVKEFASNNAIKVEGAPEINCNIPSQLISLDYLSRIIVDPVEVNGLSLVHSVRTIAKAHHAELGAIVKRYKVDPKYPELVEAVGKGVTSLKQEIAA